MWTPENVTTFLSSDSVPAFTITCSVQPGANTVNVQTVASVMGSSSLNVISSGRHRGKRILPICYHTQPRARRAEEHSTLRLCPQDCLPALCRARGPTPRRWTRRQSPDGPRRAGRRTALPGRLPSDQARCRAACAFDQNVSLELGNGRHSGRSSSTCRPAHTGAHPRKVKIPDSPAPCARCQARAGADCRRPPAFGRRHGATA